MQILFEVKEGMSEYIKKGKDYPFPPPPLTNCHNENCAKLVQFNKHGFYRRYFMSSKFSGKIYIRRYICPLCGRTISYLPYFCLPNFVYGVNTIITYLRKVLDNTGTLKNCLERLNKLYKNIEISRQLIY